MDFLLAKLLPTFFYPLSLALLLQVAALLGRQRRWSPWVSAAALLLLWVASMPWVSRSMQRQIEQRALALVPLATLLDLEAFGDLADEQAEALFEETLVPQAVA